MYTSLLLLYALKCACAELDRRSEVKIPHCVGRPATAGFACFSNCWRCLVISFRNWIETLSIQPKTIGTSFAYIHTYILIFTYVCICARVSFLLISSSKIDIARENPMTTRTETHLRHTWPALLLISTCCVALAVGQGLRLPDQQPQQQQQQPQQQQNVQQIFAPQPQQLHPQQQQQQQQQQQSPAVSYGQERGLGSAFLSLIGLQQDNDPYLARTNQNCVSGDLSECFKTQALGSFDEIFYRDQYALSDFARVIRLPETQQRSLLQEPFEYSQEPRNEDSDWDQLVKYALRRAERFVKSTALEIDVPEELTEAGRYSARFIGNDIDSELDIIEDKHAPVFTRKKLKKMIIPLLLVLKIFKLKLLLFLPFILGIAGLKKILGLAAIILPGLFAYFKLCRPQGGPGFGGGAFSGLFGGKNTFPEYSPQGVGSATYYHHHDHYEGAGAGHGQFYRQDPSFSKPYTDYYSKNYQTVGNGGNSVSFGDAHEAAYSGYYGRNTGKDIQSEQKS